MAGGLRGAVSCGQSRIAGDNDALVVRLDQNGRPSRCAVFSGRDDRQQTPGRAEGDQTVVGVDVNAAGQIRLVGYSAGVMAMGPFELSRIPKRERLVDHGGPIAP